MDVGYMINIINTLKPQLVEEMKNIKSKFYGDKNRKNRDTMDSLISYFENDEKIVNKQNINIKHSKNSVDYEKNMICNFDNVN